MASNPSFIGEKIQKWFQNKPLFKRELEQGLYWEDRVAEYLEAWGFSVFRPQTLVEGIEDDESRRAVLSQYGDLIVGGRDGIHIEVKSRRVRFTGPEDYPYPTAYVDTLGSQRARGDVKPVYVVVSQLTGGMVWVPRGIALTPRRTWDRVRDIPVVTLEVPKGVLRPFRELRHYLSRLLSS